ncbi:hypothetical protein RND81_12G075400 [Saponaria officinalis]|uniref:SAM-dependent MTase DRM-type domain-containing protein n=1 Tax=Saponaria officinalis TaxID=3572 RepID=A0AAW1H7R4_SAPOF
MTKVLDISDTEILSDEEDEIQIKHKVGGLGFEIAGSSHIGNNGASSSGTNLRSSFIGMGFSPSLIDKVIKEKGEEDADLLLDTLFAYSGHEQLNSGSSDSLDDSGPSLKGKQIYGDSVSCITKSNIEQSLRVTKSMSSDSVDSLLEDEKDVNVITTPADLFPKEELDSDDVVDDNRGSLLMMNFPITKIDFAISKLGKGAPIDELVDFITAAEIAESENCDDSPLDDHVQKNEDISTEALFGTMDKTLQLLQMGFNEQEVSLAIEKLGSEVPITELANSICAIQTGEFRHTNAKDASMYSKGKGSSLENSWYRIKGEPGQSGDMFGVKMEEFGEDYASQMNSMNIGNMYDNIKPKEEYDDESSFLTRDSILDKIKGKRPKQEFEDDFSSLNGPLWKKKSKTLTIGDDPLLFRKTVGNKYAMPMPNPPNPVAGRGIDKMLCGPPYFFYGNVVNLSSEGWKKVSQFLYALQPEVTNSQTFSALSRKEGYIHNLPTEGRFPILPKSPMTIEEAMPHTKKWWPSWDTRKQLSCISSESKGMSEICNHLGKMLRDSKGVLSGEQQTKLLYYCRNLNLVWAGSQRLAPLDPEHLERILGYPINHSQNPDMTLVERLESLRIGFQTDTLGYHLSVLKTLFPGGMTVLSIYSGIGGAEVALRRLGVYMKAVVSVESSETKRKILRRWWQKTDQTGELVQIEDIQKLTSNKLENLMRKFGEFDLVICESPCTYAEKGAKAPPGSRSDAEELDFTPYYEFVRVVQRVRTMTGRR